LGGWDKTRSASQAKAEKRLVWFCGARSDVKSDRAEQQDNCEPRSGEQPFKAKLKTGQLSLALS